MIVVNMCGINMKKGGMGRIFMNKKLSALTVIGLMMLVAAASVYAHAAILWCYVENDKVYVEAFFMGGKKLQNGQIYVVDANGNKLLEGKTDVQGLLSFDPPVKDYMKIILKLDTGHSSEFELTKQDFLDAENQKK